MSGDSSHINLRETSMGGGYHLIWGRCCQKIKSFSSKMNWACVWGGGGGVVHTLDSWHEGKTHDGISFKLLHLKDLYLPDANSFWRIRSFVFLKFSKRKSCCKNLTFKPVFEILKHEFSGDNWFLLQKRIQRFGMKPFTFSGEKRGIFLISVQICHWSLHADGDWNDNRWAIKHCLTWSLLFLHLVRELFVTNTHYW